MLVKKVPMRTCIGCKQSKPKEELARIVRTPTGEIIFDATSKANGRGAYFCPDLNCFKKAKVRKALARALETEISLDKLDELERALAEYLKTRVKS